MPPLIQTKKLCKVYKETGEVLEILRGVDFNMEKGSITVLTGASGSGKSTFLNLVGALDKPTSGDVVFNGENISGFSRRTLNRFHRRHLGFIFQFHHLLAEFSAFENIIMPARIDRRNLADSKNRADELLEVVGLADRKNHLPRELSGGERQRVALARALMNKPDLVIADEPSGNLDEKNAEILKSQILELSRHFGQSFLIATHDMQLAEIATQRYLVAHGNISNL
ncbi:lipoprotein-releasing system ATP-binding protein LolD [Fibrobacterales bacterium]|nr:lipoprotein-releasing system ATP-binding protein LolD [Fibrobacterales bacterium]